LLWDPDKLEDSVGKWSNTIHGHATRRHILLLSLLQQKNGQSYGYLMPFSVIFQFYSLRKQMMYNNSQTMQFKKNYLLIIVLT
jgi:hypothetical protein